MRSRLELRIQLTVKSWKAFRVRAFVVSSPTADLDLLAKVQVQYEVLEGWKQSIANCRKYELLPEKARQYIEKIESEIGVKVEWIGVGAARDAMIHRP